MNIVLSIPIDRYDGLLNKIKVNSREYILLKNAVVDRGQGVVEIPCEMEMAKQLLEFANFLDPEAAASIEKSIIHNLEIRPST